MGEGGKGEEETRAVVYTWRAIYVAVDVSKHDTTGIFFREATQSEEMHLDRGSVLTGPTGSCRALPISREERKEGRKELKSGSEGLEGNNR